MLAIIPVIAPLFVILGVGIIAGFSSRFRSAASGLHAFVFTFTLPAFLFTALAQAPLTGSIPLPFLVTSFLLPGVLAATVYLWCAGSARRKRHTPSTVRPGPLALAASYGNVGYLGVPITLSIIGPDTALAAALGQLLHNIVFMFGYPLLATARLASDTSSRTRLTHVGATLWRILTRSVLLNPVILGAAAGAAVGALQIPLPHVITESTALLGQAAVPVAMFTVGLAIKPAYIGLRSGTVPFGAVLLATALKLLVLPLATLAFLGVFGATLAPAWIAAAVIMAAVPVSSTASILAFEYDGDTQLTSAVTLVTSVAAIVTIPLMITLIP